MDYTTATRTFNGNNALDGYAGFRVGQIYVLRFKTHDQNQVMIELDDAPEPG